ncbi:HAMP domain-containing sensor histidine kinase [Streptomyces griseiscabiei]|uniref:histidine kinase n=1 Tax=Streptomyces griseiscabiei TaxID=2993540 RepID=A0ABU4LD18_9ACTN|nr:HAMP domain-containing sensor histidine kinase [Streptomyces griseiscabiei]
MARPLRKGGLYSLRAKLTLANVVLLAVGVVAATAFSAMGMRLYLLDSVDRELMSTRDSIGAARISMEQIDALSALVALSNRASGGHGAESADSLVQGAVFTALDDRGEPLTIAGFPPTDSQRDLAAAVGDPAAMVTDDEPYDVDVAGSPHRVTAARMDDGTTVLLATSTESLHQVIARALKLDFAVGGLLLATLACLTLFSVRRRMRPLEDMVETSSAIAEGDLTRRVPSSSEATLEVEQLRLALNSMLQQVETAYRTRELSAAQLRRFVGDASHELRTPLSAIRGYLQLYGKGMLTDPGERRRAWDRMNNEVDRMGHLVDELLTLARLDQRPELRLRNVDLTRLARDAAADLRAQQPERPVTVHADGTLLVRADESGLRQVLGNLVSNVRTHTPADVPVRIGVEREDGVVRLYVSDGGPGLCEEDAARVFDRFFRAGGGAGSGLGMAIVQGVVEAHAGEVTVTTAPGDGLKVTVTLGASPPAPRPSCRAVPGSTPPRPPRDAPPAAAPGPSPPTPPPL